MKLRLKELRTAKKMSVKKLASRSRISGAMIYAIERDERMPSLEIAHKLAQALGVTVDELIDREAGE